MGGLRAFEAGAPHTASLPAASTLRLPNSTLSTQETIMHPPTTSPRLRGLILTGILSALAVSFSGLSAAADSEPVRTAIVKYNDLNVSSPQGADALYRRIRSEAAKVCSLPFEDGLQAKIAEAGCTRTAIRDAVIKVNEPALFNVYNAKNRTPLPAMLAA